MKRQKSVRQSKCFKQLHQRFFDTLFAFFFTQVKEKDQLVGVITSAMQTILDTYHITPEKLDEKTSGLLRLLLMEVKNQLEIKDLLL